LRRDGVQFRENASIAQVYKDDDGSIAMHMYLGDNPETLKGSHVLIAAGRAPNVVHLGLDKAGVAFDVRQGIMTDAALRTNKKHIYALGDVACPRGQAPMQFTHIAGQHATVFIKKALFKIPAKVAQKTVPWVTYTDPELAHVGLREHEAVATYGAHKVRVLRWSFGENDRAQAENTTEGLIKVMVRPNGKILGATIVGPRAGELIQPWILAISENIKIAAMAALIVPYPTLGEVSKRAAGQFFVPKLFSEKTKRIVRFLMRF
jgi:pyruvate/2-oxoglutarate dehydrogenase complex dihydrolipoamide dehydrogenase (E3) component